MKTKPTQKDLSYIRLHRDDGGDGSFYWDIRTNKKIKGQPKFNFIHTFIPEQQMTNNV